MNATRCAVSIAAALALLAGAAHAQSEDEQILEEADTTDTSTPPPEETDDDLDDQVFYSGMGLSQVETEFSNLDKAINLDVTLGFRIPTVKWFGIEIDIGQTIIPGENSGPSGTSGSSGNCDPIPFPGCTPGSSGSSVGTRDRDELQMQALGVSAVVKTTGRFYATARYGYRYLATSIDELNEERSGTGMGFGVGYRWGRGLSGVELGYKELAENVESIGLTFFARINRP